MEQKEIYVCTECREVMSPRATRCPNCGYKGDGYFSRYLHGIGYASKLMYAAVFACTIVGYPIAKRLYAEAQEKKILAREGRPISVRIDVER